MTKTAVPHELKTVGVVGAGRMGTPIIGHLVRKGFATQVFDVDAARAGAVKGLGAKWTASAELLSAGSDAILICVGFDREVQELLAKGGPLRKAKPGTIVAILSTIHPKTVQNLAGECESAGLHVVDSTVCRGGEAADQGTLLSFVGGSAEIVERLTPVLRAYSADVVRTGGVGTAQVAKAVNNLILWACLVADHEGLALARHYGADIEALRKALLLSSCANGPLEKWGTQTMAWAEDDMAIVAEMAAEAGIELPQAGVNREICRALKPRRYQLELYGR
jgi:3-hydroxyisobutyrate dehydrogenase